MPSKLRNTQLLYKLSNEVDAPPSELSSMLASQTAEEENNSGFSSSDAAEEEHPNVDISEDPEPLVQEEDNTIKKASKAGKKKGKGQNTQAKPTQKAISKPLAKSAEPVNETPAEMVSMEAVKELVINRFEFEVD